MFFERTYTLNLNKLFLLVSFLLLLGSIYFNYKFFKSLESDHVVIYDDCYKVEKSSL